MSSNITRVLKRPIGRARKIWFCHQCLRGLATNARDGKFAPEEKTTHFGFETVAESTKASKGNSCFGLYWNERMLMALPIYSWRRFLLRREQLRCYE